jgi:2,4-dienoyl-CoA reductase-like NADH-dependent reductase (Old Yellow Enzyme family)
MHPEAAGNLVLDDSSDLSALKNLAQRGSTNGAELWVQLGHAGALTPKDIGTPLGPSTLDLPRLRARAMTLPEIRSLPDQFAQTACRAEALGFGGAQIHAAHGFLLSQFLSPLFNRRSDEYGGSLVSRMRLVLEVAEAVRSAVSPGFTVTIKLNSSDELQGGLEQSEALQVIKALDDRGLDLIDISGGTYFPDASASSNRSGKGPYFLDFATEARKETSVPLMTTGGFKSRVDAEQAIRSGAIDVVGLARAMVLDPLLPTTWANGGGGPRFPTFQNSVPGGVTAWYSMALRALADDRAYDGVHDAILAKQQLDELTIGMSTVWRQAYWTCRGLMPLL